MEKARLDRIWLLEIIERERHYEVLLSVKNLQELGAGHFPYILFILPCPLPNKVVEGEHFVLANFLKSLPGGSSKEEATSKSLVRSDLPLGIQNTKLAPQETKKKKKIEQEKAVGAELEGFVDWTNPGVSESDEEEKTEMSGLVSGFAVWMRKRAASAQVDAPSSEVQVGKRPKLLGPNEKAHKSLAVITVDSPDRAVDAQLALEGAPQDASKEACASLEDGILVGGSPGAEGVVAKAPLVVATAPLFASKLVKSRPS